jgi:succinoglycan biosynthesis protein ExoO
MFHPRTVLVLTRHTPFPWEDGPGAYLFDILHHLHERGFSVHVGWIAPPESVHKRAVLSLPTSFARVVRLHLPGALRIGHHIVFARECRRLARQQLWRTSTMAPPPLSCAFEPEETLPITPVDRAFAARLIVSLRPAAVIANYAWLVPLFTSAPADLSFRRICLHPETVWKRTAAAAARTGIPPTITAEREAALFEAADSIICPTATDIHEHSRLLPHCDFILAPFAQRPAPLPPSTARRLLFVGSRTTANAEGLAWFLGEVWPQVRAAMPDIALDICGNVAEHIHVRPLDTVFHGPVADLEPYYREAALVIVPRLHPGGLCLKLVEAAAHGRAIVTTRPPLESEPFLAGTVAVADTPADFAMHTTSLLAAPAARLELGERAIAAIRGRLDAGSCYATLEAALGP